MGSLDRSDSGRRRRGPGRPRAADQNGPGTADRLLEVATRLFAAKGYDGVGMREIADEVGVNVATVQHHAGSKADLYAAVFRRVHDRERAALAAAAAAHSPPGDLDRAGVVTGLHDLLDAYLDFLESVPETTPLWLRRWLAPESHSELDDEFALPLYRLVEEFLADAAARGLVDEPDPHVAVRSVVWAAHGYLTARAARPDLAEQERDAFRAYAHRWIEALYGGGPPRRGR